MALACVGDAMLSATPAGSAQSLGGLVVFKRLLSHTLKSTVSMTAMRDGSRPLLQNDLIGHRLDTRLTRPAARKSARLAVRRRDIPHGNKQYALSCVRSHNGTEHYGDTQQEQEHSNVKPFQAKLIRSQWVSAVGGIPSLPHPLGTPARCPSTSCFLTDHNQRRPRPHLSLPLPRSQHAAISSE